MPDQPYIGELMLFAGNFAPKGWALCNGQTLSIASNTALFSILGTTYGGNGTTTFNLPDLRGRAALHFGQGPGLGNYDQGEVLGSENVTLTTTQMPRHLHPLMGNAKPGSEKSPADAFLAEPTTSGGEDVFAYSTGGTPTPLNFASIGFEGGSEPHNNIQPVLVMNYCIALVGIYPSRN